MEGLIPVAYKTLKKNIIRRQYKCLSSGAAQTYNTEDFYLRYDDPDHHDSLSRERNLMPEADGALVLRGAPYRRFNSLQVEHLKSFASEGDAHKPKQLVRFRSRRILACLIGE